MNNTNLNMHTVNNNNMNMHSMNNNNNNSSNNSMSMHSMNSNSMNINSHNMSMHSMTNNNMNIHSLNNNMNNANPTSPSSGMNSGIKMANLNMAGCVNMSKMNSNSIHLNNMNIPNVSSMSAMNGMNSMTSAAISLPAKDSQTAMSRAFSEPAKLPMGHQTFKDSQSTDPNNYAHHFGGFQSSQVGKQVASQQYRNVNLNASVSPMMAVMGYGHMPAPMAQQ